MKRMPILFLLALLLPTANSNLWSSDQDLGHWGAYGISRQVSSKVSLGTNLQFRFRDNLGDMHFVKWDTGPVFKISSKFKLGTLLRISTAEGGDNWSNQNYLFVDQSLNLYSQNGWSLDFRTRFHIKLTDAGRNFIRLKPQLSYKFDLGPTGSSWFLYDDMFLQTSELGARDRFNVNWLASGFKFGVARNLGLSAYYLLRSDKLASTGEWSHLHIFGTGVTYKY